jgi:hypothetical protein
VVRLDATENDGGRFAPKSGEEVAACVFLAAAGAAAILGVPAIMSVLHLGGVW